MLSTVGDDGDSNGKSITYYSQAMTGCEAGQKFEAEHEWFDWVHIGRDGNKLNFPMQVNSMSTNDFYFYGINEESYDRLCRKIDVQSGSKKRKKGGREHFEIPAFAIRHKDDPSIVFFGGQGIQITKTNFSQFNFFIVGFLWSSTENFSFLLSEKDQFTDIDVDSVDKEKQGNYYNNCRTSVLKVYFGSTSDLQSSTIGYGPIFVALFCCTPRQAFLICGALGAKEVGTIALRSGQNIVFQRVVDQVF